MVEVTLRMIEEINAEKFPSNIIKEYHDVVRELISILALLDGYKTVGEGAHKELIDYLKDNYSQFSQQEIIFLDQLRTNRNRIIYDGFFINSDYLTRNKDSIRKIINKLNNLIKQKIK
mgnify:CR=1 FL=1